MALTDILFDYGDTQDFILEAGDGTLNSPQDILFETEHILEIGPSYPDPEALAAIIWAYENRSLTS